MGAISQEVYASDVARAEQFLDGKSEDILSEMQERMMQFTERLEFEKAAVVRDQIAALSNVLHRQTVETTGSDVDADIITVASQGTNVCVNLAMVRGSRHLGDRAYFPNIPKGQSVDKVEVFEAFVSQHYESMPVPTLIITDVPGQKEELESLLSELSERRGTVVHSPVGVRREWLNMCKTNADIALARHLALEGTQLSRLQELGEVLGVSVSNDD